MKRIACRKPQTNARGFNTQYQFDALNRQTVSIDASSYRTSQLFDGAGNLTSLQDSQNNTSTFSYDALDRKTGETDPLGKRATFAYDGVGLMTSSLDRLGRERRFSFDSLNRLTTQVWYSSGTPTETLVYSFDAVGNQLTAQDSDGTYTMTYDALNRVTVSKDMWGKTLTMTYDSVSNRTKVEDSHSGVQTSTYDGANNLTRREHGGSGQTPLRLDLTYTSRRELETQTRYSDLAGTTKVATTTLTYDALRRTTNLKSVDGSGTGISNFTYTYDAANRLETEVLNGTTKTYTYDNSDQLTADGTTTVTYDGTGNRNNGSYTTGTGNRMSTDGTWNYTYNDEGNQTKKVRISDGLTWTYAYDHRNQLTTVERRTTDGGTLQLKADVKYDVHGNRIEYAVDTDGSGSADLTQRYSLDGWKNGTQKSFVGNENWDVWADLDGSSSLTTRYLRGDVVDQVFARTDAGGAFWLLADRLGSVRDVLDNTGVVKSHIDYDGFGNVTTETGSAFTGRYTWTGRERDKEIELQYNRARYYDPKTGKMISEDPKGFEAGDSNLYRYVNNRHLNATDPSGNALFASGSYIASEYGKYLTGQEGDFSKGGLGGLGLKGVMAQEVRNGRWVFLATDREEVRAKIASLSSGSKERTALEAMLATDWHMEVSYEKLSYDTTGNGVLHDVTNKEKYKYTLRTTQANNYEQIVVQHHRLFMNFVESHGRLPNGDEHLSNWGWKSSPHKTKNPSPALDGGNQWIYEQVPTELRELYEDELTRDRQFMYDELQREMTANATLGAAWNHLGTRPNLRHRASLLDLVPIVGFIRSVSYNMDNGSTDPLMLLCGGALEVGGATAIVRGGAQVLGRVFQYTRSGAFIANSGRQSVIRELQRRIATGPRGGRIAGAASEQPFQGQGLGRLANARVQITQSQLNRVTQHVARFPPDQANQAMLARLRAALAEGRTLEGADAHFFIHELIESGVMSQLERAGLSFREAYDIGHRYALESIGASPYSVYHIDVIRAHPDLFNDQWIRFWETLR